MHFSRRILSRKDVVGIMTTYYVNKETGDDANDGTDRSAAFASVAKVNTLDLQPGDTVLFARGQVWQETLVPQTSGTADNPITFGGYGEGKKAVFDGGRDLTSADWQQIGPNQWQTEVQKEGALDPGKVYFGGEAGNGESANSWNVDSAGDWNWTNGQLTVYSTSNPRGSDIAVQVRDEAIRLDYKDHLVFEDIATKRAFNGITLYEGADDNTFENVSSHSNTLHGFWIRDSDGNLLDGIRAYDNGQPFTKLTTLKTGEGVWLDARSDDTTIRDSSIYGNAQHGVNYSFATGDGHEVIDSILHHNGEAGLAIAGGNQTVTGNTIYANDLGGIVATINAETMTLKDNVITAPADLNQHALFARGAGNARFVSEDNKYKGDIGHAVYLHAEAGDNSTFTDDLFVASKTAQYLPMIWLDGGENHSFDHVSIVSKAWQGVPIGVYPNASAEVKNSFIYGSGHHLVGDIDGGGYSGINNNYYKPDSDALWITKGTTYHTRADIDAGRVDSGSTTQPMTPGQIEGAWARGTDPVMLAAALADEADVSRLTADSGVVSKAAQEADLDGATADERATDIPQPIQPGDPLYDMTDGGATTISVLEAMRDSALALASSDDALMV
ncbi:right-handed parallel beta-helix repeat-containing protein [Marinivivus vitaminiproducens]|uniref:right-handed parallel beta-helix repeat-containing protein n=1 Tax=Marinivivus vitaminiproducens TaxID=3035935 RepID=UPI0027999764|nr:right-handed parallel beta-helix repeat-containing protein [Geminicoccaceae bacterium SCSIO 64248]